MQGHFFKQKSFTKRKFLFGMALHTCDSCIYYLFIFKQNIIFILCYELHFIMYDTMLLIHFLCSINWQIID